MGASHTATIPIGKKSDAASRILPQVAAPQAASESQENHLGGYEVQNRIASGGMGTVYLARHSGTGRTVALKLLSPHISHDTEFIARFKREAHIVAALDHPHIVQVYDAGQTQGYYYLAMEYLPYGSLKSELKRYSKSGEGMSMARVLEMARQIGTALDHAHRRGLVHRDIKPSNILKAAGDRYVLTDFGVALDTEATRLTRNPDSIGTPEYMSPEQIEQKQVDARSDLYSLGVVLYELLAGVPPFDAEQPMVVLMKHVHEAPPPLAGYRSDLPKPVLRLVERLLHKDPDKRFQSAGEMVRAIEAIQGVSGTAQSRLGSVRWPRVSLKDWMAKHKRAATQKPRTKRSSRVRSLRPVLTGIFSTVGVVAVVFVALLVISPATVSHAFARLGMIQEITQVMPTMPVKQSKVFMPAAEVSFQARSDAVLRMYFGPGETYPEILAAAEDLSPPLKVLGRSLNGQWLQVEIAELVGWVNAKGGVVSGKLSSLPVVVAPSVVSLQPYTATFTIKPMDARRGVKQNKPVSLTWQLQGVTSLTLRITGQTMSGFDCPAGDAAHIFPVLPANREWVLPVPMGERALTFGKPGYYLLAFTAQKADGSQVREMRHVHVGCSRRGA
jgi:serine/threonine protein kinase